MKRKKLISIGFILFWCAAASLFFSSLAAAAITVRVQPSGADMNSSYVVAGETRTYFGMAEGGDSYTWTFSDGASSGLQPISALNYISVDHAFPTSSPGAYAMLTVNDSTTGESGSAIIHLWVRDASDSADTVYLKNSAVDKSQRYLYQNLWCATQEGEHFGDWISYPTANIGLALTALGNQGHNIEADESDIYKKFVQEGLRYLFNTAEIVDLSVQPDIGDPEGEPGVAAKDDLDSDNDGDGVKFPGWNEGYESPIAMLGIINSCKEATARTTTVQDTESPLYGQTYWDVIVDAKDFLAYAQSDDMNTATSSGYSYLDPCGGEGSNDSSSFEVYYEGSSGGYLDYFYMESYSDDPSNDLYKIEYGDETSDTGLTYQDESYYSYWNESPWHWYNPGTYTITSSVSHDNGVTWVPICSREVTFGAAPNGYSMDGWHYSANQGDADNSVSQWPVLALREAEDRWNIHVNPMVKEEFKGCWLIRSLTPAPLNICPVGTGQPLVRQAQVWPCSTGKATKWATNIRPALINRA